MNSTDLYLKSLALCLVISCLGTTGSTSAAVVTVELNAPIEVAHDESKVIADFSTVIPNLVAPVLLAMNHPNEGAWSARLADMGSSGPGLPSRNNYIQRSIGVATNAMRRFEKGDVLDIQAPTVYYLGAKSLWTLDNVNNEWTTEHPRGIAGILLVDEFDNLYPAFVEVEVDPANNGTSTITRYGYSTIANQSIVIPIPEPSSVALLGLGSLGLAIRRRTIQGPIQPSPPDAHSGAEEQGAHWQ